ncbi:dUTP diphosphatase [Starkeya koreensis]|uniref:Deoxyuridine 5'-triphosphate nucleotidohydrolase n=1 Tax=Ancylobacter koreensis TaxID=266121 RepID=A0ABT0DJN0_9HYPH|nr:dUTP diphosphatase [Ancylobacter koreensis]
MSVEVPVRVLAHGEGLPLPDYATPGAAGLDLIAALPEGEPLTLAPLARAAVPTGLCLALPDGYEAQVRPRSGLALKQGLTVLNAPGTVDSDYRGEVKVLLVNLSDAPVVLERGQRIAQMVVAPVTRIHLAEAGNLTETTRGDGGFGSTGLDGRQISR